MKLNHILILLVSIFCMNGCLVSEKTTDLLSKIGEESCIAAAAVAYDGVMIQISIPAEASKFMIKRDGVSILETSDKSVTTKIDTGLFKGQTYRYTCAAILDINEGYQDLGRELVVTLESDTPPVFGGISSATPEGGNSVKVEWSLSSDEVISHYKVFKHIGITTDSSQFPSTPVATIYDLFLQEYTINGLGDQIDYSFRVVACNASDICDNNNAIETAVLSDTGAPLTTGISDIGILNGDVWLTVLWDDTKGLVSKRTIFRHETTTGTTCPSVISSYTSNDINIVLPKDTPTYFKAPGSINQGMRYCYIVRDSDSLAQQEMNSVIRFVDVGDLTPPVFNTSFTLTRDGVYPENKLTANWIAIDNEAQNPLAGASEYIVYLSTAIPPAQPNANPCVNGTQYGAPISTISFPQGMNISIPITGLSGRNNHRVCVRAKDSSGNYAANEPAASQSTGDETAPLFNGIDNAVFNAQSGLIDISFLVPMDVDVKNYLIKISRDRQGVVTQLADISAVIGLQQPGSIFTYSLTMAQASAQSNDILNISVDSCDDAKPIYNSDDNCTLTNASRVLAIPDSSPPAGFEFINYTIGPGSAESSVVINWTAPPSWSDYAGFKLHYVDGSSLVDLDSSGCVCSGLDCSSSPRYTCEVFRQEGGAFLDPARQYEFYLSAYDSSGFSTQQYIAFTGGSKKTVFSRTRDKTQPVFNADFDHQILNGDVVLNFAKASDNQYSGMPDNHEITYQVYRKADSNFNFPCVVGDLKDPDCDGGSVLLTTQTESQFSPQGVKLSFVDATVLDGKNYYYQVCSYDFSYTDVNNPFNNDKSTNRKCQTGNVELVAVTDTTIPTITNFSSDKEVLDTAWSINFDVNDNNPISQLNVKIYRSTVSYPNQMSPGVPVYTSPATVSINGTTGATSFNDTGVGGGAEYYYLAEVSDAAGNKAFLEFRDMNPAPVIASVGFSGGAWPNGEVPPNIGDSLTPQVQTVVVQGSNLENVTAVSLRDSGSLVTQCPVNGPTGVIAGRTSTQITCTLSGRPNRYGFFDIRVVNSGGDEQVFTLPNAVYLREHCEYYTDRASIEGLGNSVTPYALCFPEHFNLIGNGLAYQGFFNIMKDIDFVADAQGPFSFAGIPSSDPEEVRIKGVGHTLSNVTIEHSSTNPNSGFYQQISGTYDLPFPILEDINFTDLTLNSSATNNIGLIVGYFTSTTPLGVSSFQDVTINGAVVNAVGNRIGGIFGFTSVDTSLDNININNLVLNYNDGGNAFDDIGGMIGSASNGGIDLKIENSSLTNSTFNLTGAISRVGGFFGTMFGKTFNVSNNTVTGLTINQNSSLVSTHIGGLIGYVSGDFQGFAQLIEGNTVSVTLNSSGPLGSGKFGGMMGAVELGRSGFQRSLKNNIDFTFNGTFTQSKIGGVFGSCGNCRLLSDLTVEESAIKLNVANAYREIGGIFGNFNMNYNSGGMVFTIKNNYVDFQSLTANVNAEVGGINGTYTRHSTQAAGNEINIENNHFTTNFPVSILDGNKDPLMQGLPNHVNIPVTFINNYYNSDVINGDNSMHDAAGEVESLTTVEMQNPSNYSGWDFSGVWRDRSSLSLPPNLLWEP